MFERVFKDSSIKSDSGKYLTLVYSNRVKDKVDFVIECTL
jgi:hypothetical protein